MSAIPFWSRDDWFYRYVGVNFTFGLLKCDGYIWDIVIPWIVKSGFCSIHFTVILAGLKNVKRYIGNIVILKIVTSGFHCIEGPITWGGLARLTGLARFARIWARLWNTLKINFAITWKISAQLAGIPASWCIAIAIHVIVNPGIAIPVIVIAGPARLAGPTLSCH